MPLVAEIFVIATQLSLSFREDYFYAAIDREVGRREDVAACPGLAGSLAAGARP